MSTPSAPVLDRRVRRSRESLMRAAIELVSERGTTAVSITDIADAADVSRQVLYLQFGDRDNLLLEAALDLARRELPSGSAVSPDDGTQHPQVLAVAHHFAEHRAFYRAMLTGSCAFALNEALSGVMIPVNREVVRQMYGEHLDARTVDDLATFITGGAGAIVNAWVIGGEDPPDPAAFTDRLMRLTSVLNKQGHQ
ncbi:TetR/AcrR family transcriptional regulator [Mycobacterium sp. URHB0044]|uniref:TetR/AcrR family transcriptional regulator n=1 Tax=Mycobacterium sp. URHB0044 TaxID=1380386 RepID=UPI00048B9D7D|nr:TetR/AcrR family transcriptional regulator [Mycobacterium sp. URHB0044]